MLHLGMFLYPWDAQKECFLDEYASLGCNMVAINAVYHQCAVLDSSLKHVYERRHAGTSFVIHPQYYGCLMPRVEDDLTAVYDRLHAQCEKRNIDWRCWVVNLHNSEIGERFPETTVKNAWGDHYSSSLCLNNPDVQEYACALLRDIIATLTPSRVVMETESWMQAFHGRHHEFSLTRITPAVRYLLSLCFCPHCIQAAEKEGIDAQRVQKTVRYLLERLIQGDTTFLGSAEAQVMQIFLEYPDLYAYQQFRINSVERLVRMTSEIAHSNHVLYEYIPSAAPFTINQMYYEGTSFKKLSAIVDGFVPLCYSMDENYRLIKRNVHLFAPDARVSLALNLSRERYNSQADFASRIREAIEDGVQDVYCYNYGLASQECRGWLSRAFKLAVEKERG